MTILLLICLYIYIYIERERVYVLSDAFDLRSTLWSSFARGVAGVLREFQTCVVEIITIIVVVVIIMIIVYSNNNTNSTNNNSNNDNNANNSNDNNNNNDNTNDSNIEFGSKNVVRSGKNVCTASGGNRYPIRSVTS